MYIPGRVSWSLAFISESPLILLVQFAFVVLLELVLLGQIVEAFVRHKCEMPRAKEGQYRGISDKDRINVNQNRPSGSMLTARPREK